MKFTTIVCAIAVASLGFSTLSLAQERDRRGGRQEGQQVQQMQQVQQDRQVQQQVQRQAPQQGHRGNEQRYDSRHDRRVEHRDNRFEQQEMRRNDRIDYFNARSQEFRRGGHIPRDFRNRQYVVTDYRSHQLAAPPRGHQWVQVGPDYVLIAIATGLIANIILSH